MESRRTGTELDLLREVGINSNNHSQRIGPHAPVRVDVFSMVVPFEEGKVTVGEQLLHIKPHAQPGVGVVFRSR